jgi:acyl-CoA synthetase (AMP-forming)/AMP-acid ligase II
MQSSDLALLGQSMDQLLQGLPERISSPLLHWARERPDALAAIDQLGNSCSFAQLLQRVTAAQDFYLAQGIVAGDRVLLINENSVALLIAILALSEIDAISVVVNARLAGPEIRRIQQHCQPRMTVCLLDSPAASAHWQSLQSEQRALQLLFDAAPLGLLWPDSPAPPLDESALPVQQRVCVRVAHQSRGVRDVHAAHN